MALRIDPSGGVSTKVTSVCHLSRSPYSTSLATQRLAGPGVVDLEDFLVLLNAANHRVGVGDLAEVGGELLVLSR